MNKLLLVLGVLSGVAQAGVFRADNQARALKLIGTVDGGALVVAQNIEKLSRTKGTIDLLINSPGGSVSAGMAVVDAIRIAQERGITVRCVTGVMAASMGFIILAECNERYALANARLLFHPISLSVRSARVQELFVGLQQWVTEEAAVMDGLRESMGMNAKVFHANYFAETFWQAKVLSETTGVGDWLQIVESIEGFGNSVFVYRKARGRRFRAEGNGSVAETIRRYETGGK